MRDHPRMTWLMLVAALVLLSAGLAAYQSDEILPGTRPRSQFAPYYSIGDGYNAILGLTNTTRAAFVVRPTLFSLEGRVAPISPLRLEAHETKEIDLSQWVSGLGDEFSTGSLQLDYESAGNGLGAMVMMMNERESLEVAVLARPARALKSSRLESLWWIPDKDAEITVAVQNTLDTQVQGTLILSEADGHELEPVALTWAPHQTRVFRLHELVEMKKHSLGGISIRHEGRPGALLAHGFVVQRLTGFSANLQFEDPATFGDAKLEGAGVLVGRETETVDGPLFFGHLFLRNVSLEPVEVSGVLQRGDFQHPLPPALLQPGNVREIPVPAELLPHRPGPVGITIRHTGLPGSLIAQWLSVDESRNLVVETPLRSPAPDAVTAGTNPWLIEGDFTSVLYVKNTGEKKAFSLVAIHYTGGTYVIGLKEISAGETLAIDLRGVRDSRMPDANGHMLPPDLSRGQIVWFWKGGPPLVGRVNTMSLSRKIARNMSCPGCCCAMQTWFGSSPYSLLGVPEDSSTIAVTEFEYNCNGYYVYPVPNSYFSWISSNSSVASVDTGLVTCLSPGNSSVTGSFNLYPIDDYIDQSGPEDCYCVQSPAATDTNTDVTVKPVITSISPQRGLIGATTAVTIVGKGFGTSPTVQAGTGITVNITSTSNTQIQANFVVAANSPAGDHSVTVTASGQTSGSVNFFVQIPTTFRELSVVTSSQVCDPGTAGRYSDVRYQVFDQAGSAIEKAGLTPQEHFTVNGTPAFTGFRPFAIPPTTDSLGRFLDTPVGSCFGPPVPAGNPCADVVQTFNIIIPTPSGDVTYTITTITTSRDCALGQRIQVSPGGTYTFGTVN